MGWRDKPVNESPENQNELAAAALANGFRAQGIPEDQIKVMLKAQRDFIEQSEKGAPIDLELNEDLSKGQLTRLGDKSGKAKWVPDLDLIEKLAGEGLPEPMIAAKCGIKHSLFLRKKEEYPEMDLRIQRAYANKIVTPVMEAAMFSATKLKNPLMIQFLLNSIGKFDDGKGKRSVEVNVTGEVKQTHVFVAPEQLEDAAFQALVARQRTKAVNDVVALEYDEDAEIVDEQ